MGLVIFFILYGLIGTVIGRILFRHRLGKSSRYFVDRERNEFGARGSQLSIFNTHDYSSAQTYGLWSIPLWPLTVAVYMIQAPTPREKAEQHEKQLEEMNEKLFPVMTELRH